MEYIVWGLVILAGVAAYLLFRAYRRIAYLEFSLHHLEELQRQVSHLQRGLQDVSMIAQQQLQTPRTLRNGQPVAAGGSDAASPYNQAIELFKRGFSPADVAERCGISRSEAELILSLYRNSSTS
ncbi:DUF2802 domain-containing protein [Vogesella sp. LIG4]|uniref:DUF2802 domain-containing protein n=1 Tax=Vogesella sp. LIG4 TaxID=1192162 RepID=UPI00081F8C3D|nr:DUF2802 domain-containing protein [Vogesella sp. LIG4]SCK16352.1 Protein of unknown function [Vogesella sp. LIG4]